MSAISRNTAFMQLRQLARSLEDTQTELIIQTFADRILVLITQLGKVGNLIQATLPLTVPLLPSRHSDPGLEDRERVADAPLPPPPPSIQLTPLFGSAPTEQSQILNSLYASQTATLIWLAAEREGGERKPVVVGIALKKSSKWDEAKERRMFMSVMEMITELLEQKVAGVKDVNE